MHVPTLLNAQVCVDAGIAGCACEVLVFAVGDVHMRLGITVLFGQSEVDEMHLVGLLAQSCKQTFSTVYK